MPSLAGCISYALEQGLNNFTPDFAAPCLFFSGRMAPPRTSSAIQDEIEAEAEAKAASSLPCEVESKGGVREDKSDRARVELKCSKRRKSEPGNGSGRKNQDNDGKARWSSRADEGGAKVKGKETRGDSREGHGQHGGSHEDESLVCVVSVLRLSLSLNTRRERILCRFTLRLVRILSVGLKYIEVNEQS